MKMRLEDANRVVNLCLQMRKTTSQKERFKLVSAIIDEWHKVSEPLLYAAEDAAYFGTFGKERERATPLDALPALALQDAEVYVCRQKTRKADQPFNPKSIMVLAG